MNDIFNENVPLKTETPAFAKHVLPAVPSSEVYLEDCVTALKRYADNHFDLAIVDPPYLMEWSKFVSKSKKNGHSILDSNSKNGYNLGQRPKKEYFDELFRVSKNQIIWGMQYIAEFLPPTQCCVCWDKKQLNTKYSEFELAFTSFKTKTRIFTYSNKHRGIDRIHPTQKPVELYDFLLKHFANDGDLILDTHLGSGSSRIAAYKGGFNFVGFEIDSEYYEKQEKRFNEFKSQLRLF